jgi:hypothetical protein
MQRVTRPTPWMVLPLAGFAVLLGPISSAVGKSIDHGQVGLGMFGIVLLLAGQLLRPLASGAEAVVFGLNKQPWFGGQLRRSQKFLLPSQSGAVLPTGLSCAAVGASYLLSAPPGRGVPNGVAFAAVVFGSALLGFGLSRLAASIFIIHVSGRRATPAWAWRTGVAIVVLGTLASVFYGVGRVVCLVAWL